MQTQHLNNLSKKTKKKKKQINKENTQSINHQLKTENEIQIIRSITHKHKNPHNRNASHEIFNKITNEKARINEKFNTDIKIYFNFQFSTKTHFVLIFGFVLVLFLYSLCTGIYLIVSLLSAPIKYFIECQFRHLFILCFMFKARHINFISMI